MTDVTPFTPPVTVSEAICDYLQADPLLHEMLTGIDGKTRIYPRDMRAVGWGSTPEVFDQDGLMLSALCVDDTGDTPVVDAPHVLTSHTLYVWAFSDRGKKGHREITAMMERCRFILHNWTSVAGMARFVFRLGIQDVDDGAFDRMTIAVTSDFLSAQ